MAIDNPAPSLESIILNTLTEWIPVLTGIVVGLLFGLFWHSVKTKPTGPSPIPPVTNRGHFSVDSPSLTPPVTNHGHPSGGAHGPASLDKAIAPAVEYESVERSFGVSKQEHQTVQTFKETNSQSPYNSCPRFPKRQCYNCGEKSHLAKYCPYPWNSDARVFYRKQRAYLVRLPYI